MNLYKVTCNRYIKPKRWFDVSSYQPYKLKLTETQLNYINTIGICYINYIEPNIEFIIDVEYYKTDSDLSNQISIEMLKYNRNIKINEII